jgi:hypothetical protein
VDWPVKPRRKVRAERVKHGRKKVTVKRDCDTGRFLPSSTRSNRCAAPVNRQPSGPLAWLRSLLRGGTEDRVCYTTKAAALHAFKEWNQREIDHWGIDRKATGGEFDAVNERYELRGARKVRTLAAAIWACQPAGAPFCLDRFDLETLNDTSPGREREFTLPDPVVEKKAYESYERGARDAYEDFRRD